MRRPSESSGSGGSQRPQRLSPQPERDLPKPILAVLAASFDAEDPAYRAGWPFHTVDAYATAIDGGPEGGPNMWKGFGARQHAWTIECEHGGLHWTVYRCQCERDPAVAGACLSIALHEHEKACPNPAPVVLMATLPREALA